MADELIDLLRRHDPAAALRPLPATEAGVMRDRIVRSAPPRRAVRRRRSLVLAFAVGALALVGAGAVYSSVAGDDHAPTVEAQFAAITRTIALPPGAHWRQLDLPQNALYGQQFALMAAVGQAQCAWYSHWNAAAQSGDSAAVAQSYAAALALRKRMPQHPAGASEDAGGYDAASLALADREIATAHHGDFTLLRQDLRANCS